MISLGGGVQSSTMLLMAAAGEIGPLPELALFADTGAEPQAVYAHLDFLRRTVGERIPIVTVTAGDLRADIEAVATGEASRVSNPPVFVRRPDGRPGPSLRKCTRDYKVRPIERELRARGFGRERPVEQWLGISLDEVQRMKPITTPWISTRWPLIEERMTRHDCLVWLDRNGYPRPPKSACTFCPYHSDRAWRDLRDSSPAEWDDAVEVDAMIRRLPGLDGDAFLHRQLVPLAEVDLRSAEERGQTTLDLDDGGDECGGGCFT